MYVGNPVCKPHTRPQGRPHTQPSTLKAYTTVVVRELRYCHFVTRHQLGTTGAQWASMRAAVPPATSLLPQCTILLKFPPRNKNRLHKAPTTAMHVLVATTKASQTLARTAAAAAVGDHTREMAMAPPKRYRPPRETRGPMTGLRVCGFRYCQCPGQSPGSRSCEQEGQCSWSCKQQRYTSRGGSLLSIWHEQDSSLQTPMHLPLSRMLFFPFASSSVFELRRWRCIDECVCPSDDTDISTRRDVLCKDVPQYYNTNIGYHRYSAMQSQSVCCYSR